MSELIIHETFDQPAFDPRLHWFNPPSTWSIRDSCLIVEPDAKTDYWQKTHYGFVADNGHFLFTEVTGDFILTTHVHFQPAHQYDQAGLMVRLSPNCWLKTSVEYEIPGPSKLGAVVTNYGYSDWSTQNFLAPTNDITLRLRREGSDYLVEYLAANQEDWVQIRMAHLHEDQGQIPVKCGLYTCSPIEAGYIAAFDFLKIEKGRIKMTTD